MMACLNFIPSLMGELKGLKQGRLLIRFIFLEGSCGCFFEKRLWGDKSKGQDHLESSSAV